MKNINLANHRKKSLNTGRDGSQNLDNSIFEIGNKKSKINHFIVAENIKYRKIQFHHSISDHKLISLEILDVATIQSEILG